MSNGVKCCVNAIKQRHFGTIGRVDFRRASLIACTLVIACLCGWVGCNNQRSRIGGSWAIDMGCEVWQSFDGVTSTNGAGLAIPDDDRRVLMIRNDGSMDLSKFYPTAEWSLNRLRNPGDSCIDPFDAQTSHRVVWSHYTPTSSTVVIHSVKNSELDQIESVFLLRAELAGKSLVFRHAVITPEYYLNVLTARMHLRQP